VKRGRLLDTQLLHEGVCDSLGRRGVLARDEAAVFNAERLPGGSALVQTPLFLKRVLDCGWLVARNRRNVITHCSLVMVNKALQLDDIAPQYDPMIGAFRENSRHVDPGAASFQHCAPTKRLKWLCSTRASAKIRVHLTQG
jgi:hypothetical protein